MKPVLISAACAATSLAGASAVGATAPPDDPAAAAEVAFVAWAASTGTTLGQTACDVGAVTVCYGIDPASGAVMAATLNADGASFTAVAAPAAGPAATVVEPGGDVGTRGNPVPIGTTADIGDGWTLTIDSVDLDAWDAISGANSFNDPPAEGTVYVMIHITTAYAGPEDKAIDFFSISGVTSANVELNSYDVFVVAPDAYDGLAEVFAGGSKSGNVVMQVLAAEVESLVLYTSAGFSSDDVYFVTR